MSGLETLPPDQRAVLQLILVQGRGYADLAALLKLDVGAVRDRAHAGVVALGVPGGDALDAVTQGRVADYLLGQQDDGERIVTFAELGESAPACRWAQALRERLVPLAAAPLPEVPAAAATNGHAPAPVVPAAAAPAPQAPMAPPPPPPPAEPAPAAGAPGPSSRLGGAVLLAGVLALAVVLAIVLIGGGDDDDPSGSTTPTQTQTARQPTRTTRQPTARIVAQVNLAPTATGGQALGLGLVQQSGRARVLAIEAQRLPANGTDDIYAVWLQGGIGARFLGFVPRQVREGGRFTVSADLPANASVYSTVLITRESTTAVPQTPGEAILTGELRLS